MHGTRACTVPMPREERAAEQSRLARPHIWRVSLCRRCMWPSHGAIAPASCQASVDGVGVVAQSLRTALQGHAGTRRRPCPPGIQRISPPLAHQPGKILGSDKGGGQLGMLGLQLGDLRRVVCVLRLRPPPDQPGGPARGQGAGRQCGHIREGHTTPQAQEGGATDGEAQATASAGPAEPARATAMCTNPCTSRGVRRAPGAINGASRSVKMRRGQRPLAQKTVRTCTYQGKMAR